MKNPIHPTVIALLLAVSRLPAATLYVTQAGTNPTRPYTNWVTAATNLQQAVDVAAAGDVATWIIIVPMVNHVRGSVANRLPQMGDFCRR